MKHIVLFVALGCLIYGSSAFGFPGQVDATYTNVNLQVGLNALLALPDGRVVVGFNNTSPVFNGTNVGSVLQLNFDGSLDGSFSLADTNKYTIYGVVRLTGGNLLVAGSFTNWAGSGRKTLVKLDATGAVQSGFLSGVTSSLKLYSGEQPDGKILLASTGTSLTATNGAVLPPVARLLSDGTRDPSFFTTNIIFTCYGLDLVPDGSGRYFLGFLNISNAKFELARFNADGTFDNNFVRVTFDNVMSTIHALGNGGVFVGGAFTNITNSFGSVPAPHLVRINPDGSKDASFNFTDGRNPPTFVVQSDGKVVLPNTTTFVGQDRFNLDGSLDGSWTHNAITLSPSLMTIDSSDRVLCDGFFTNTVLRMQNDASFGPIAPFFSSAPANVSVYPGDTANFSLNAGGPGPITYNWQFNSNDISGATNPLLTLTNCQPTNGGFYRLVASNANGSTPSSNGLLTIRLEPRITQNPQPTNADASDTANFLVTYSSLFPVTFQWFSNTAPILGATNNPLVIAPVSSTSAGNYFVVVSNVFGAATSSPVVLSVNSTLRFKTQPVTNLFVTAGVVTNLSAVATGEPALAFQWFMNGVSVPGANSNTLAFNPIDRTNSGTYYLVVTNNSGSITSLVAKVAAFAPPLNSWITTNALPSGSGFDLKSDGALGVVLIGTSGVSRFDDDGGLRWSVPFTPSTNVGGLSPGLACAVDGQGNTYVTSEFTGTLGIGGLSATNPGIHTVPNPNGRGALLAKLDITGQALWIRYIDGGLDFSKLAVDGSGGVVISGAHNGVVNFGNGGSQATPNANGGVLARYNSDGILAWVRNYASTTGGLVEIDAVVAQGTNIWVGGIFNFNVKFGTFTATDNSVGHAANSWFGCLNTNGTELWLQALPEGSQFPKIAVGTDNVLWAAKSFLARFNTNGTTLIDATPFIQSGGTITVSSLNVDSNNAADISGYFNFTVTIGTNNFTQPNTFTNNCYTGRYNTNGTGLGAVVEGTSTANGIQFQLFDGNRRGDVYVAGVPPVKIGTNNIAGTNFFLAKLNAPVLSPSILSQPNAGSTNQSLSTFQLSVTAQGQSPLSYQWRNNGVPIPNQTNATLSLASPLPSDGGAIDCLISNFYGTVTTIPSQVAFNPPFVVLKQPGSVGIIFGTNAVSGSNIVAALLQPSAMVGHTFNLFITNGSGMWPNTGDFVLNLPTANSFNIPSGTVGTHSGSWAIQVATPQATFFSLFFWSTSPSNVPTSVNLDITGQFGIHHDITDPAGCCGEGYYTIAPGGSSNAVFTVQTTGSVVPAVQWYRNGVALPGKTGTSLSFIPAGYAQVGTYTATLTFSNYVTTTIPATLSIFPPALGYTFVPGNTALNFTMPPGYVLQSTVTLAPQNWITISTNSTFNVPLNQPGAFFRIVPQP